jgi:hypothetical protein
MQTAEADAFHSAKVLAYCRLPTIAEVDEAGYMISAPSVLNVILLTKLGVMVGTGCN